MKNKIKLLYAISFTSIFALSLAFNHSPEEVAKNVINLFSLQDSNYDQTRKSTFYETYFEDEMPIFGFVSMPKAGALGSTNKPGVNPSFINHDVYQLYKDAGFNVVCPTYQRESAESIDVHREIEVCQDIGLKYLVRDMDFLCTANSSGIITSQEKYMEKLESGKDWYLNHPNVIGIQTTDEPNIDDFDNMGNFYKALYEYDKTKWAFTTLFPPGANAKQLHVEDLVETMSLWEAYQIYVRTFVEKSNSAYILYDQYSNITKRVDYTYENTTSYMRTLSFYSHLAKEYGIRFMTAVASYRHAGKFEMTPEEIYRCTNLQLAYGSKGIEYYTYWPTIGGTQSMTAWENTSLMGLVTSNGIPHDTYYHVKNNNDNIKAVQKYLMNAEFAGIRYFGQKNIYIVPSDILSASSDLISDITGGDAFVGVFNYQGKKLYYVVNSTVTSGLKDYVVKFKSKHKIHLVNSKVDATFDGVYASGFALSAGEAILLEVD